MPFVRVSDDGKDLEAERKKKNKLIVGGVALLGSAVSFSLYFYHSPEAGIFAGLWPATILSALNILNE